MTSDAPVERQPVLLVSGLSGAGKASILRALEDAGYEAIDNPPLAMVEELVRQAREDIARHGGRRWLAIGVDARSRGFDPSAVLATLGRLRLAPDLQAELVYAWAEPEALRRRFSQTRRRHPLAPDGRVLDGILIEQALTAPLRAAADLVIDTTDLPLPELRRRVEGRFGAVAASGLSRLAVTLVSFAFPAGLPGDADMVFDVRFLRNPHYVDGLGDRTGLDLDVAGFVQMDGDFGPYFAKLLDLVAFTLPRFVSEGKKYVTVAVGCTGGRHRSVAVVEKLAVSLRQDGWRVASVHRELAQATEHDATERRTAA